MLCTPPSSTTLAHATILCLPAASETSLADIWYVYAPLTLPMEDCPWSDSRKNSTGSAVTSCPMSGRADRVKLAGAKKLELSAGLSMLTDVLPADVAVVAAEKWRWNVLAPLSYGIVKFPPHAWAESGGVKLSWS